MSTAVTALRLGFVYLIIIGSTMIVQAIANRLMKDVVYFLDPKEFPLKGPITMLILLYITVFALLTDVLIWTAFLMVSGILPSFWDAFTFATDSFTTLGSEETIPPPWEYIGAVISVNGIVIIAFAGACLYSMMYKV